MKSASINISYFSELNIYNVNVIEWTGIRFIVSNFNVEIVNYNTNTYSYDTKYIKILDKYNILKNIKRGNMSYEFPKRIQPILIFKNYNRKLNKNQKKHFPICLNSIKYLLNTKVNTCL
jgi:hypothetical protein